MPVLDTIIRQCCWHGCGEDNSVQTYEGKRAFFCSGDLCNGGGAERMLDNDETKSIATLTISSTDSLACYECSDHSETCGTQDSMQIVYGCQACMIYRNVNDGNMIIRRCCTSGCGEGGKMSEYDGREAYFCTSNLCNEKGSENGIGSAKIERHCCYWNCGNPGTITEYDGRPTYFCANDKCNGLGAENLLGPTVTTTTTTSTTTTTTTSVQSLFTCYDCSGFSDQCGTESTLVSNCRGCMVYRNPVDQTKIDRHCCYWDCGTPGSVSQYNGRETYFCSNDRCNGIGTEGSLAAPVTTTTAISTTTTTVSTTTITITASVQSLFTCYDCSGFSDQCGTESTLVSNCRGCMVYRNPVDQTKIDRHCCYWDCGTPG
ncbi:unnamed protein product, partial [Didymodactylos carnosus]